MSSNNQAQPSHEAIALRAFHLWSQAGQPMDSGERHWLQAEAELKNGASTKPNAPIGRRAKRATAAS